MRLFPLICSVLFSLFFAAVPSHAAITIESVTGADMIVDPITTQIQVRAGFAGECANPGTDRCDTCSNTTYAPCGGTDEECCGNVKCKMCNTRSITDTTVLTIIFRSSSVQTGIAELASSDRSYPSTTGVGSGGRFIFTAPWREICPIVTGTSQCTCEQIRSGGGGNCNLQTGLNNLSAQLRVQGEGDSASLTFRIFHQKELVARDNINGALFTYSLYPGDEKVYMENPDIGGYSAGTTSSVISQVRVFIGENNFNSAFPQQAGSVEPAASLSVDNNGVDSVIDGLDNDVTYHFRTASVDEAGNVFAFMDNKFLKDKGCTNPENFQGVAGGADPSGCPFHGTPSKVMGLLSDDMNCFIATAAYGSSLDPHIDTFRNFRFKVLLRSELGQKLNRLYYNYGPKAAHFIKDRPWAQTVSRILLWPVWAMTSLSLYLKFNLWQSALLFGAAFGGLAVFFSLALHTIRKRVIT